MWRVLCVLLCIFAQRKVPLFVACVVQLDKKRQSKDTEKRSRLDKEKVMDMLFAAFEKHQYYNVKDLVGITKQPIVSVPALGHVRVCVCVCVCVCMC